jgi:hypothetical protein
MANKDDDGDDDDHLLIMRQNYDCAYRGITPRILGEAEKQFHAFVVSALVKVRV